MLFANKIKESRESKQILQRHISAVLDMDNAMYCKIERGERKAKREQVINLARTLGIAQQELLVLWLADQIIEIIADEKELSDKALSIVKQTIN